MADQAIIVPAPVIPAAAPAAPAQAPAAPAAAPAATPAASPAPAAVNPPVTFEPPPPPAAPAAPQDATVVYEATGDAGLDVALAFIGERGFGPDHPAMQAAMKGDFAPIDAALKALGDKAKGADRYINLAKDSYGRRQAAETARSEAASKTVYDAVGGAEKWAAIHAWVTANADADEKAQINAAFKAGGLAAASTARHLAALHAAHGKTAPAAAVKADAGAAPAQTPLSDREYGAEVRKLHAKLGSRMEDSPEYATLKARRASFRA